ncbi:MAG: chemotaxis protein CheA [Chloroflexi bacterium]|nr:chemotaxis protein CheA [Chloroflexota bacterium]
MNLDPDITREDLQVFLDEADEQLQLLDENIVAIEGQENSSEGIQEIFRAAHTLKGSSAMLGYQEMTDLGHAMETLLDKVRKGTLAPTTVVVDALLASLDLLRELKDALVNEPDEPIDVTEVVAALNSAGEDSADAVSVSQPETLDLDDSATSALRDFLAESDDRRAVRISATLNEQCTWASVRWFQAISSLETVGQVFGTAPSASAIEEGTAGHNLEAVFGSTSDDGSIESLMTAVEDVLTCDVTSFDVAEVSDSASEPVEAVSGRQVARSKQGERTPTIRVDVERLDTLMNVIGEMVIDRGQLSQIGRELEANYKDEPLIQDLAKTTAHIVKVVTELQDRVMQVRMLPIGTVFGGFPRMLRDLAHGLEKKVDFIVDGQDTEIDKTVIERVRDPITHLLRNSLDHGLEKPAERIAAGKSETGSLSLSAYQEQGHIVVAVQDDGRGINPEALRASAVEKGLITKESAAAMSDDEARELIFVAGNSTAEKTTDVSGRGVGMDIVRSNIEAIGGIVNIESQVGVGTTIKLRLPLTLATVQSLLVSSDGDVLAVPLIYVLETRRIPSKEIHLINHHEVFNLRGQVLPLLRLRSALGRSPQKHDASDSDSSDYAVVLQTGETRIGLVVDAVIEPQEIVVKPLGSYIGDVKGITGASIMGDGRVCLILDVASMISAARQQGAFIAANAANRASQDEQHAELQISESQLAA